MLKKLDVRWHARAGQGAVTAAHNLAEIMAQEEGAYARAFAVYGAEKRGAPVIAFTRLSDHPIRDHSEYMEPDVVLLLDPTLVGLVNIIEGAKKGATVIVNTSLKKEDLIKQLNLKGFEVYTLDANKISREELGRAIPNVPMLGALSQVLNLIDKDSLSKKVEKLLKDAGKFSDKIIRGNVNALKKGFEGVR
jgi:pyruvate ferredoxin oxidoreductase gamma subunit